MLSSTTKAQQMLNDYPRPTLKSAMKSSSKPNISAPLDHPRNYQRRTLDHIPSSLDPAHYHSLSVYQIPCDLSTLSSISHHRSTRHIIIHSPFTRYHVICPPCLPCLSARNRYAKHHSQSFPTPST